ncbi:HAMP domain-containing histidine kinase [Phormidium pseudopriestleyi FRX01]|uniref:histidine kinase n=1 Tax=Phormidium pseudopriestleyi FRX01 TaxID=1759528 RepID=A0ABS3FM38_9CYAN|nr:HAMP domain-containing sensor histidine kinase [Phormidium pseudopriestleyi]MBO0348164.1 HAMP domain-containing histidine kinase [Phormidium pseudopriestleyi FRX01]
MPISQQISNRQFSRLQTRLLLSYLLVIATILGVFSTAVYALVVRDRHQQLNASVHQMAGTSASTLEIIQHEYQELTTEDKYKGYIPRNADGSFVPISLFQLMGKYQADSMPTFVYNPLTPQRQAVEWFDSKKTLIVREGRLFPSESLPNTISPKGQLISQKSKSLRSFILPVYSTAKSGRSQLLGYVRATESTNLLNADLRRFRQGLIAGVAIVSGLVTMGGFWLTRESLKPILQSFEQLKQFTSDASHELRGPLTAIRASIAVMQSHPERVHPADVEKLKAIASASVQMSQLVDDLLLLARMDRQAPDLAAWRQIALDEILEDLVDLYSDRARETNISLQSQLIPNLEVYADAFQLSRLLTNLLTNALQYTPSGGSVTVSLQRRRTHALIRVEDTGIGIAPEQLPHIFDRFWRADQARSQHQGGSGLGLAIAKTIAQTHGGDIIVHSQLGQGSCFQVKIPLP